MLLGGMTLLYHFLMKTILNTCHEYSGHCKSLAPEYAKAAKRLRENNPPYYIAKVDATENKVLAEKHGIKGFPTLFFFRNGVKSEYNGGRVENEIVNWILKKVGPPSQEVTCD